MIAAIPQILSDTAAFIGATTVILGGITAIVTRRPFKWLWRTVVSDPFGHWFHQRSIEANKPLIAAIEENREALEQHREYVQYHLGPNGETRPIHVRLQHLELASVRDAEIA